MFLAAAQGDKLANRFILIANLAAKDGGKAIVAGNERVIAARLADAKFFFDQDRNVGLEDLGAEAEGDHFPRQARQPI